MSQLHTHLQPGIGHVFHGTIVPQGFSSSLECWQLVWQGSWLIWIKGKQFLSPFQWLEFDSSCRSTWISFEKLKYSWSHARNPIKSGSIDTIAQQSHQKGLLLRNFVINGASTFHSPPLSPVTACQLPPERKCLSNSCSANWNAISQLGDKWLERIEQNWKIALKHSKVLMALPRIGLKQMISWHKWARRWYLIFRMTLVRSIRAVMLKMLAAAVSISSLNYLVSE